jgi:hypothetical protein
MHQPDIVQNLFFDLSTKSTRHDGVVDIVERQLWPIDHFFIHSSYRQHVVIAVINCDWNVYE